MAKEPTEAEIAAMEETARNFRIKQQAARERVESERLIGESEATKGLREFVASDQYKKFVETATAVAQAHTGMPLVQHLVGALTSLSVVSAEVGNAEQRYEQAAAVLKGEPAQEDNL